MEKVKYTITKHPILPCNWINSGTLRNCHKILASSLKLLLTFRALTCRAAKESPFSLCWTLNTVPKVPLLTIKNEIIIFINLVFFYICVEKRNVGYLTCHSAQSSAKKVQLFGIIVVFSWLKWSDLLSEQKQIGQNYVNKQLTIWTSFYLSALLQYISIFRL